jgi:hypothetical protein
MAVEDTYSDKIIFDSVETPEDKEYFVDDTENEIVDSNDIFAINKPILNKNKNNIKKNNILYIKNKNNIIKTGSISEFLPQFKNNFNKKYNIEDNNNVLKDSDYNIYDIYDLVFESLPTKVYKQKKETQYLSTIDDDEYEMDDQDDFEDLEMMY